MDGRVRVLVVDDSAFARKVIREVLDAHPLIDVVGVARDGLEALEQVQELRPDEMTLDLVMPNHDGIGVLHALDPETAPRVVVVSISDSESDLGIAALQLGAVDIVHKPTALATDRLFELSGELCHKVLVAGSVGSRPGRHQQSLARASAAPARADRVGLIAIGTSTGGPQALSRLIPALPADLPVPVVVALHIPDGYTDALARRLDAASGVTVVEAADMPRELAPGLVVIARGGAHLTVSSQSGRHTASIERRTVRAAYAPSVDHLFRAAAREYGERAMAVVLTGMGDDGLEGARAIREAGGSVIVEAASSCVVHGMPRSVLEAGLASAEAPLHEMIDAILSRL